MGRLITETKYSEVTATLERLDEFGVTAAGLKKIRTMSPALLRQLSRIIEIGVPKDDDVLPGLCVMDVTLDSKDTHFTQEMMRRVKIFESMFIIRDVLEKSSRLPVENKKFIALTPNDFGSPAEWKTVEEFSSDKFLKAWSEKNLLGRYCLVPCKRSDAAIHIALVMDAIDHCPRRMILIYSRRDDWITIDACSQESQRKEIHLGQVDFSYNCPAVFELQKV